MKTILRDVKFQNSWLILIRNFQYPNYNLAPENIRKRSFDFKIAVILNYILAEYCTENHPFLNEEILKG